ncbi:ribbon-helix-helix domain-containing protein [Cylindrospermum sp. FACHB-282]|uniref:ribbon-helix-helix domain-containing protein n=1 Tax=Cylindrospermum sp. FACHB-282 TaxID=2692794 RepID=UPI0016892065|nr:type II toxin-antitoxin system ParD family antitoxin [Cylindrospermum sp. FACHB-282]MBD2384440.1 type II toxin-antitoxin system ParD family antitoxin [Cylindrospermum sp. FACHB-282]
MNIQIKPELEQIIAAQIATGRYANPEDVISKALKLLLEWEQGYQQWVEETREKVDVAIEQLDRGEGIHGDIVIEQLRDKLGFIKNK